VTQTVPVRVQKIHRSHSTSSLFFVALVGVAVCACEASIQALLDATVGPVDEEENSE